LKTAVRSAIFASIAARFILRQRPVDDSPPHQDFVMSPDLLIDKLTLLLTAGPVFLFSLVFHEYCHALAAYRLGDRTAAWTGRLTLNPAVHMDPMGTVAMPLLGLFATPPGAMFPFIFGWARPVPFNPRNLRDAPRDSMLIALAGPVGNLALLVVFALLCRGLFTLGVRSEIGVLGLLFDMAVTGIYLNALLAAFNMIPLPPLDGSKVLAYFLPGDMARNLLSFNPTMSFLIILFLVFQGFLSMPMGILMKFGRVLAGV